MPWIISSQLPHCSATDERYQLPVSFAKKPSCQCNQLYALALASCPSSGIKPSVARTSYKTQSQIIRVRSPKRTRRPTETLLKVAFFRSSLPESFFRGIRSISIFHYQAPIFDPSPLNDERDGAPLNPCTMGKSSTLKGSCCSTT